MKFDELTPRRHFYLLLKELSSRRKFYSEVFNLCYNFFIKKKTTSSDNLSTIDESLSYNSSISQKLASRVSSKTPSTRDRMRAKRVCYVI